ncbi:MAG: outer membrane homotrimeric porin [Desulfovibrio sp.]|nr:outer membrane homotrimeric porin [Desulfovibrio sp.]
MLSQFKKHCMVALLAAGMVLGAVAGAQAIDFKVKGRWQVGFGLGDMQYVKKTNRNYNTTNDYFTAQQRVRLQLDAVASEALSGTVWFEIGNQEWGNGRQTHGGALGADGNQVIKIKNAYLDWIVPQTDLKFRMGIQAVKLPSAAGGTAILDADVAGITASYQFNDNVGLTAFWYRPVNDNYTGWVDRNGNTRDANYLDNMDIFGLALPLTFDGVKVTPWGAYAAIGRNAFNSIGDSGNTGMRHSEGLFYSNLLNVYDTGHLFNRHTAKHAYSNAFFFGLPIQVTAWDPLNIEFDFNYGYVEGFGRYNGMTNEKWALDWGNGVGPVRANSKRSGWLVKALVEYKLDWGVPGIFGWYASGEDGNVKNGSERMPSIAGGGNFSSNLGQAGIDWPMANSRGIWAEQNTTYAGTWGIGARIRDMSFLEDLTHTFRVAYWGGTNSTKMTKYFTGRDAFNNFTAWENGPFLTTNDGLVDISLENKYKIYENLAVNLDLGYVVNCMNKGTWDRRWMTNSIQRKDGWKAQLMFDYTF